MVSDVLLLSYLDKIGLSLTGEAGQASAYLYREARLHKGARLAGLSQSATTRSTGNISVQINTRAFYCSERIFIVNKSFIVLQDLTSSKSISYS